MLSKRNEPVQPIPKESEGFALNPNLTPPEQGTKKEKINNIPRALDYAFKNTLETLKTRTSEDAMDKWFNNFSIVRIKKNLVVFRYTGNDDLSEFYENYYDIFTECFFDTIGYETEIKIEQVRIAEYKNKSRSKRIWAGILACILVCAAGLVVLVGMNYLDNLTFEEDFYQVGSGKIGGNLRIIQLSDLHDASFGKDNETLIGRISVLKPDIIVTTGDMVDKHDSVDNVVSLYAKLTEIAPVYCAYGNNEDDIVYASHMTREELDSMTDGDPEKLKKSDDAFRAALEKVGVHVLLNEKASAQIGENTVDIYGVLTTNPSAFWNYCEDSYDGFLNEDTGNLKVLLCHEPYIFETFGEGYWGDLVLCGHTHGGVVRLPYLGGLYERKNGLFPEKKPDDTYIAGKYDLSGKTLIVSRGLSNKGVVRIGNQPELVIIDVNRY